MNPAHHLTSPVSPYNQRPSQQTSYFSDRHSSSTQQTPTQAGLGLYPLTIPQTSQQASVRTTSPHQGSAWSQNSAEQSFSTPVTSHQDMYPNSPFESFSTYNQQNQPHHASLSSPEAPALEYCQSATSSELPSHRSSVCSYTSEASEMNMSVRTKPEEQRGGWYPTSNDHGLQRSMASPGQIPFSQAPSMMPQHTEDLYRTSGQADSWSPQDGKGFVSDMQSPANGGLPTFDMHPVLPSVTRIKKKRRVTTPEEATHECRICKKLFKRSYNWKSHMETHNPDRKYPHPCTAMVGNQQCPKKFQRKTDLDRHHDSVHLKARNHKCQLCGNRFARRDTLRRHTEDGCPKRFELGIRDSTTAQMQQQQQQQQQQQHPQQQHGQHQPSAAMPPMHQPVTQPQQPPRWAFSMAPSMMPTHYLTASPFPAHAMPPPAVPYQV